MHRWLDREETLTDIAGSSAWFDCGIAAYSYEAKQALLGVRPETLELAGAVSRETVIEEWSPERSRVSVRRWPWLSPVSPGPGRIDSRQTRSARSGVGWKRRGGYAQAELFRHFDGDREAVRRQTVAAALKGVQKILTS